ncbi:hypothetical protein Taro_003050 [Colocasia esculenta]|uniref:Uncharacterized protein n=1 Tax=Colocasia esculenta TaxID=4460 RepID=A0A843TEE3_COLES|nr:hypothetical protein [Colocasia esculenta]
MYQGAWQPGQAVAGGQFPVPPPAVPEQQEVEPEVEQPERQQRSGTGSIRAGRQRTAVTEDRIALLERFLRLRPPMFHGEYDLDKAESWTHELERIFETMECVEEDQQFSEVFHGEYFPDYARSSDQACAERFIAGLRLDLSSGSCLLAGVDRAVSRGVSPGLQSSQYSRVLSRAVRSQRHGLSRLPIASPQTQSDRRDKRPLCQGYVAFLKATHPLSPFGSQGDTSMISMLPSPVCGVSPVLGRFPEEESPEPPTGLKATYPVSPSDWAYVAFLAERQVVLPPLPFSLYCTRGTCASSLADSGAEGKTVVRTVACESLAELSWLVWDAEDSLEFYPVQASQSFFSLPRSLRPQNCLERSGLCGGHDEQSYGVSDREYFPYRVSFSFASALPFVGESSQQRQGACRAEETGR